MLLFLLFSVLVCVRSSVNGVRCPAESSFPWCDTSLPFEHRVELLVNEITDEEAVTLLGNGAKNVSRLSIPNYQWWNEGLHGVAHSPGVTFRTPTPVATSFPQVITTASSFDVQLFADIGEAIGVEGRAFNNAGNAGLTYWTPNINVAVDPRWGRLQETPGEDPYLNSVYGATFVKAFQNDSSAGQSYIRASACVKHFDTYHLETNRFSFDGNVSEHDLQNTYMLPMAATIPHASCIMCAYVAVNGVPSCANSLFMQKYARGDFKFRGYLTGDCGAVRFVETQHKYTTTNDATVSVTLGNGVDIDCGSFFQENTMVALKNGAISRSSINRALSNLFWTQMKLGMFDPPSMYDKIPPSSVNSAQHQQLALDAALRSLVLIRNDAGLPWSPKAGLRAAVVGPNADATTVLQGNYFGQAPYLISPLAGFQKFSETVVTHAQGCAIANASTAGFAQALEIAKAADRVVAVMGLDQTQEREGHDRTSLTFPGVQRQFIEELIAAVPETPITLVLIAGGAIDLQFLKKMVHSKLSIIYAGYPGQSGGDAIAQTVYGLNNPSGRLSQTWYQETFVLKVALQNMNMRSVPGVYPGRTYRYLNDQAYVVYPFGHGLSYSTFAYSDVGSTQDTIRVQVENSGRVVGADVVLAFNVSPGQAVKKQLFFFQRVLLEPGHTATLEFARPKQGTVSIGSKSVGNELHLT